MRHLYAAGLLMSFLLVGCNETRREVGEASRETSAAANRDRMEYQRSVEARLDRMDREIDVMQAKARNATGKAKQEWNREVAELQDERREARAKYNEMKNATDANWESFKDGVGKAADNLEAGYNRMLEKMKTNN